jgi:subtilisin family serine protease
LFSIHSNVLSLSNWGECVDIYAPGDNIWSAWIGASDTGATSFTGTSAASPFVSGAAALYLQRDSTMTPADVKNALKEDALSGILQESALTEASNLFSFLNVTTDTSSLLLNVGVLLKSQPLAAASTP